MTEGVMADGRWQNGNRIEKYPLTKELSKKEGLIMESRYYCNLFCFSLCC